MKWNAVPFFRLFSKSVNAKRVKWSENEMNQNEDRENKRSRTEHDEKEKHNTQNCEIVNERMNEYNENDIYGVGGSFADLKFQIS